MFGSSRRNLLTSIGAGICSQLFASVARATLVRGLTLTELVSKSQHVVIGRALARRSLRVRIGEKNMIVTETRVRIEGSLVLPSPGAAELVIRTLGGVLDGEGELVHGQAEFEPAQQCLGFLLRGPDGAHWVTGMAQGHYPLVSNGRKDEPALFLRPSPQLPAIRDWQESAVKHLVGARLNEAERRIREAWTR